MIILCGRGGFWVVVGYVEGWSLIFWGERRIILDGRGGFGGGRRIFRDASGILGDARGIFRGGSRSFRE